VPRRVSTHGEGQAEGGADVEVLGSDNGAKCKVREALPPIEACVSACRDAWTALQ
jgi:hypothetical protein